MSEKNKGMKRLYQALINSGQGLQAAYKSEEAFRQEVWLAVVLLPVAFFIGASSLERIVLILSVLLVLICELFNSAIETVVDRVSLDIHPLSKKAKDIASAAILISLINLVVCWGMVLLAG